MAFFRPFSLVRRCGRGAKQVWEERAKASLFPNLILPPWAPGAGGTPLLGPASIFGGFLRFLGIFGPFSPPASATLHEFWDFRKIRKMPKIEVGGKIKLNQALLRGSGKWASEGQNGGSGVILTGRGPIFRTPGLFGRKSGPRGPISAGLGPLWGAPRQA